MKIQGPHHSVNTYKQWQQQHVSKKRKPQKDELNISDEAKQMQKSQASEANRKEEVSKIKDLVQSGEYKINPEKIADKMVDFWS